MSFRLPNRIPSKRASSFHFKKIVTPLQHFSEDTEKLLSRHQAVTPNRTKTNRAVSFMDMNNSPKEGSKYSLHPHIFDTPKTRIIENRNQSIADQRVIYINDIHEKFSPLPKPQKPEITKKSEEKLTSKIFELTKENDLLRLQLEKYKYRQDQIKRTKTLKEIKHLSETFRLITETFIVKVREALDTLCTLISIHSIYTSEVPQVLESFNTQLQTFIPLFGEEFLSKHYFVSIDHDQNTGRFKSLSDTQHSFQSANLVNVVKQVIGLSDFKANNHGELDFKAGERIELVKTDDPEWWLGKIGEKVGRIPARLVMLD